MENVSGTQPTTGYAQRCAGGVCTGIVGVYLGHTTKDRVKVCGNGRMHTLSERGIAELQKCGPHATEPAYCKYHKLASTGSPTKAPDTITLEFELSLHTNRLFYQYLLKIPRIDTTGLNERDMTDDRKYQTLRCTIELKYKETVIGDEDSHEYTFQSIIPHFNAPKTAIYLTAVLPVIERLTKLNKYVLAFQTLLAHAEVPGLYFGMSVGYPADQLAVLLGAKLFAQHKFDRADRHNKKIIHVALESVLAIFERSYDDLMQVGTGAAQRSTQQKDAINAFCQRRLDAITERYIRGVLDNIPILTENRNEKYPKVSTSDMREVCEYERLCNYTYLVDCTWTFNAAEFERDAGSANAFTSTPRVVHMPSEQNMRAVVYTVASSLTRDDAAVGIQYNAFNAFNAYSVFWAYAEIVYLRVGPTLPHYMYRVLIDAFRLHKSIKSAKKSSVFALTCLRKSCEEAVKFDANFYYIAHHMVGLSERFIAFILSKNPIMSHPNFADFVKLICTRLSNIVSRPQVLHSLPNIPKSTSLEDMRQFKFEGMPLNIDDGVHQFQFLVLVLGTQLNAIAKLLVDESERKFTIADFGTKNYFQLTSARLTPTPNVPPQTTQYPNEESWTEVAKRGGHTRATQHAPEGAQSRASRGGGTHAAQRNRARTPARQPRGGGTHTANRLRAPERQSNAERHAETSPETPETGDAQEAPLDSWANRVAGVGDRLLTARKTDVQPATEETDVQTFTEETAALPTGRGTRLAAMFGERWGAITEILYPTSLYYQMFWKYEYERMDAKTLDNKRYFFKAIRTAMEDLRIREEGFSTDVFNTFNEYVEGMAATHKNEKTVGDVESYLKNVAFVVLSILNNNDESMTVGTAELWFDDMDNLLKLMKPLIKQTLGMDANCTFRCDYAGFSRNAKKCDECETMLLRLYEELKRKAYTNRERAWEPSDGTDTSKYYFDRFCSENGEMTPIEFRSAVKRAMHQQNLSILTVDSIFNQIRTAQKMQKRTNPMPRFDGSSARHNASSGGRGESTTHDDKRAGSPKREHNFGDVEDSDGTHAGPARDAATSRAKGDWATNFTESHDTHNTSPDVIFPPPPPVTTWPTGGTKKTFTGNKNRYSFDADGKRVGGLKSDKKDKSNPDKSETEEKTVEDSRNDKTTRNDASKNPFSVLTPHEKDPPSDAEEDPPSAAEEDPPSAAEKDPPSAAEKDPPSAADMFREYHRTRYQTRAQKEAENTDTGTELDYEYVEGAESESEDGGPEIEELTMMLQMQPRSLSRTHTPQIKFPFGFVTRGRFGNLFIQNLKVHLYIEVVKMLHAHIQVLKNIERERMHLFYGDVFAVATPEDDTDHDNARGQECRRRFVGGQYKQWWQHFSDRVSKRIMNVRSTIFDNVVHTPEDTDTDRIRRIFSCNNDIQFQDYHIRRIQDKPIHPNDMNCTFSLQNSYEYEISTDDNWVHIGTNYEAYRQTENVRTEDTKKWGFLPKDIPPEAEDAVRVIFKDNIKKIRDMKFHFDFKIYEREFIKIKLHDETCVNVPLDPTLVCGSQFTWSGSSVNGTEPVNGTASFGSDRTKKYTWNFNTKTWEYKRGTWRVSRIARIVQSAGDVHTALNSNCMLPAAQSLWDICKELLQESRNKESRETLVTIQKNLGRWRVSDGRATIDPGILYATCKQLEDVAAQRRLKIERELDAVNRWPSFTEEIEDALAFRYPCLVMMCDVALGGMQKRWIDSETIQRSISDFFVKTAPEPDANVKIGNIKRKTQPSSVQFTIVLPLTYEEFVREDTRESKRDILKKTIAGERGGLVKEVTLEHVYFDMVTRHDGIKIPTDQMEDLPELTEKEKVAVQRRAYYESIRLGNTPSEGLPEEGVDQNEDRNKKTNLRRFMEKNGCTQLRVVIQASTADLARKVKARLTNDSLIEALIYNKFLQTPYEFRMTSEPRVNYIYEQTQLETDKFGPIKRIYSELISSVFRDADVILPQNKSYSEDISNTKVPYLENETSKYNYEHRYDNSQKIMASDGQFTKTYIDFDMRKDETDPKTDPKTKWGLHDVLNNRLEMLNFLIVDCLQIILQPDGRLDLLITAADDIVEQFKLQPSAADAIRTFNRSDHDHEQFDSNLKIMSDKLKYIYSSNKLQHPLLYDSTNTSDIFDFLQKQYLLYWTEIMIVNLDANSDDEAKFVAWKCLVTNFLNRLVHKHTEDQLNALFLYVDPTTIDKMILGLEGVELASIDRSVGEGEDFWFKNAIMQLGQDEEVVRDPVYFGRRVESRENAILRLQGRSIRAQFASGEVAVKSYHMNDRGCIKRCICDELTPAEAENASNHASRVDLWLNVILTTMHIQLTYFRSNDKKLDWTRPVNLSNFLKVAEKRYFTKWLDSAACNRQAQKDTQPSDFGETQIRMILKRAEEYDTWMQMQSMDEVDANNGVTEEKVVDDVDVKNGVTEQVAERQESVHRQLYVLSVGPNKAIFRSELEEILSHVMDRFVYRLCKDDERQKRLIRSTFNAAINNASVAEFKSEDYLFRQKKTPTVEQEQLHGHMQRMLNICRVWYKIPDITYTPQGAVDLRQEWEPTIISEFKVLYMSEERNRAFHRNRVG